MSATKYPSTTKSVVLYILAISLHSSPYFKTIAGSISKNNISLAQLQKTTSNIHQTFSQPQQLEKNEITKLIRQAITDKSLTKRKELLDTATNLSFDLSDLILKARLIATIAQAYNLIGGTDKAEKLLIISINIFRANNLWEEQASAQLDLGDIYLKRGEYIKALVEGIEAYKLTSVSLSTTSNARSVVQTGKALVILSNAYQAIGETEKALFYIQVASAKYKQFKHIIGLSYYKTQLVHLLNLTSAINRMSGHYQFAMENLEEALELAREINNKELLAKTYNSIGANYHTQSNYTKAIGYYNRSLEQSYTIRDVSMTGIARLNICLALTQQRQYGEALIECQRSLNIFEEIKDMDGILASKKNISYINLKRTNYKSALEELDSCILIARELGEKRHLAESIRYQGLIFFALRQYEMAVQSAEKSLHISQNLNASNSISTSASLLGKALFALKDYDNAAKALLLAISNIERSRQQVVGYEQERMLFFEDKVGVYHTMMELLLAQGKVQEAFLYAEKTKGRALLDSIREGRAYDAKLMTSEEREQESMLRAEIVRLNTQIIQQHKDPSPADPSVPSLPDQLERARVQYEDFYAQAQTKHLKYRVNRGELAEISLSELRKTNAEPGLATLEYVITEDHVYLYMLDTSAVGGSTEMGDWLKVYTLPITPDDLKKESAAYASQIAGHKIDFKARGIRLYEKLIKPVEEFLTEKKKLCIIPDGPLWELPFQALITSDNKYLLEKYSIFYSPSLRLLNETERRAEARSTLQDSNRPAVLGIGNPLFETGAAMGEREGGRLTPLPEAEREIAALSEIYPDGNVRAYLKAEPTETTIKREIGNAKVLHFATHGILDNERPLYSFLVLAKPEPDSSEDGMLEAWEIAQLNVNADLVILSACESGKGKVSNGEGMVGMAWAFMIAGAPTTIVSQWKVDSASTSQLMTDLHLSLSQAGLDQNRRSGNSQALREAAVKLMQKPQYRHPFFWAGFIVLGSDQ